MWREGVHCEEPQGYREMEECKASPGCRDMVYELALSALVEGRPQEGGCGLASRDAVLEPWSKLCW